MRDQVEALKQLGVNAAALNSSLTREEAIAVRRQIHDGTLDLLYVTPERTVTDGFVDLIGNARIALFAIDEAHCISQWGHDFRPEYRSLGRLKTDFPGASIHAFTATATVRVREDMAAQLGLRDPIILVGPYDRANLTYRVVPRTEMRQQVQRVLGRHAGEAGIIY